MKVFGTQMYLVGSMGFQKLSLLIAKSTGGISIQSQKRMQYSKLFLRKR